MQKNTLTNVVRSGGEDSFLTFLHRLSMTAPLHKLGFPFNSNCRVSTSLLPRLLRQEPG